MCIPLGRLGAVAISLISVAAFASILPAVGADSDLPGIKAFSANVRVNSGGTPFAWQVEPTMVISDGGTILVGWKEANSADGGGQRVSFSRSLDGGSTWSSNILMATSNPGTRASDPWLIKDGMGNIHYTRLEFDSMGTVSGITTSNTTNGLLWGAANYLDDMPNFADKETVAADSNGVLYMAYNSNPPAANDLVFRKSFDGGATWTSKVRVPASTGAVIGGYVALDSTGRILVAWTNAASGDILIDSSTDGGFTWGADVRVNDVPGSIDDPSGGMWNLSLPSVAIDSSDNVYVIYTDYRLPSSFGDIYVSRSRDHGVSWDPGVKVNDDNLPAGQRMADITVDENDVLHAAWYDHRLGGYDVYYSSSSDGGRTWSPNLRVTTVTTSRSYTRPGDYITIRTNPIDDSVNVVWTDGRDPDFNIYFASMSISGGLQTITTNPVGLSIIIDGSVYTSPQMRNWGIGEVHVIGTSGNQSIAYGTRYSYIGWSDSGAIVHQINITGSGTYTADFILQYSLNVDSPHGTVAGSGWYDSGTSATGCVNATIIQLSPDTRYRLMTWGEDASGGSNCSDPITMDSPKNATAIWATQYLVTVTSPYGTVTGDGWHDEGNTTYLVLNTGLVQIDTDERASFESWSGDASGSSTTSDPLNIDSPKTAQAQWRIEYLLTIVSAHGTPQGGGWYPTGDVANILVDAIVSGGVGTRYVFSGWTGSITSDQASATILMSAPATVTAQWVTEYHIQVLTDHGVASGTGWYEIGSIAYISVPSRVQDENGTWLFLDWDGDFNSSQNDSAVLVDAPKTIRANWILDTDTGSTDLSVLYFSLTIIIVILILIILIFYLRRRKDREGQPPPAK